MANNVKTFKFNGLDGKTERRLNLYLSIPTFITIGTMIVIKELFFKIHSLSLLMFIVSIAFVLHISFLKQYVKRIKDKQWTVSVENECIQIRFQNQYYAFSLSEIRMISNIGDAKLRHLTIQTHRQTINIRVGNSELTPFSTNDDIEQLDAFVAYLMPYIHKNFNQKMMKNKIAPSGFKNFGVYVVKGEFIKYSFINKLTPAQIEILVFGCAILIILVLLKILFYYIDNR